MFIELNGEMIDSTKVQNITKVECHGGNPKLAKKIGSEIDTLKRLNEGLEDRTTLAGDKLSAIVNNYIKYQFYKRFKYHVLQQYLRDLTQCVVAKVENDIKISIQTRLFDRYNSANYYYFIVMEIKPIRSKNYETEEEALYVRQYVVNTINSANPITIQF